jgi:5-methylcytosine-specific restriction endonuclease McrA
LSARPSFTISTKRKALLRQKNKCAICGLATQTLGIACRGTHEDGDASQAHHIIHAKLGGNASVENCVIICSSCHYSDHEGGNYRYGLVVKWLPFLRCAARRRMKNDFDTFLRYLGEDGVVASDPDE